MFPFKFKSVRKCVNLILEVLSWDWLFPPGEYVFKGNKNKKINLLFMCIIHVLAWEPSVAQVTHDANRSLGFLSYDRAYQQTNRDYYFINMDVLSTTFIIH